MKEDFILPVCPNENFAGALSSSDRWVTEVQCLPSQGESGCQNGVQKRGLQGEKTPVSAAVCTILVHCSPGNPARKVAAEEKESRWQVVELLWSWLSLPHCKALVQAEFASCRTSVATISWSFRQGHWNPPAELCLAHWLTASKLQPSEPAFPSWITHLTFDKSQWTPFCCKGEPVKFILLCITEIPTESSSGKAEHCVYAARGQHKQGSFLPWHILDHQS